MSLISAALPALGRAGRGRAASARAMAAAGAPG